MSDGFFPSDMATGSPESIEEELRLAYVACTRAKKHLYVLWPLRYHDRLRKKADTNVMVQLCRFFDLKTRSTMEERSQKILKSNLLQLVPLSPIQSCDEVFF